MKRDYFKAYYLKDKGKKRKIKAVLFDSEMEDIHIMLHKTHDKKSWVVTEMLTGLAVCQPQRTAEDAIHKGKWNLYVQGYDFVVKCIKDNLMKNGLCNFVYSKDNP